MTEQIIIGVSIGVAIAAISGACGFAFGLKATVAEHGQWIKNADATLTRHETKITAHEERCSAHMQFFGQISETLKHLKESIDEMKESAERDRERAATRGHTRRDDVA